MGKRRYVVEEEDSNEPNYGDKESEELRRDSYNADNNNFGTDENVYDYIVAEHGYHGYIDHPTRFLVGEAGKERVNITPIKGKKKGTKRKQENIFNAGEYFGGFEY